MSAFKLNGSMFIRPLLLPPSAWIGHIPFAGWCIEELRPRTFVELGTHNGASYLAFCQAVRENALETKCFAVDTWKGDEHAGSYGEGVFQQLDAYHRGQYAGFSQLMRMTFDEAAGYFADGSIDLLHIDGLHTYDAVRHDFETWLPKLSERAVVLFHDTMVRERNFGVWKLWEEVARTYPSFEFQHSHGLGVLLVGKELPESIRALAALGESPETVEVLRLFDSLAGGIAHAEQMRQANERVASSEQAVEFLQQQLSAHQAQIASARDELGKAGAHAQHQAARTDQILARTEQLLARTEQLERTLLERDAQLAAANDTVREQSERIDDLQREFDAMAGSKSWRLTAPIRRLSTRLRGRND